MTGDAKRDREPTPHHWGGPDEPVEDEYAAHRRREAEQACGLDIDFFYGVNTLCGRPSGHDGDCRPVPLAADKEDGDA